MNPNQVQKSYVKRNFWLLNHKQETNVEYINNTIHIFETDKAILKKKRKADEEDSKTVAKEVSMLIAQEEIANKEKVRVENHLGNAIILDRKVTLQENVPSKDNSNNIPIIKAETRATKVNEKDGNETN